jgi:hypothetical protein
MRSAYLILQSASREFSGLASHFTVQQTFFSTTVNQRPLQRKTFSVTRRAFLENEYKFAASVERFGNACIHEVSSEYRFTTPFLPFGVIQEK